ncbi:protein MprA [Candidatus Nitrosopumilus koreensis AR1]|uniref:Protein MprA n=1 Tax=Candidatus Nitrosopumilus koreensis AR1 TaxID=1229908 RepID=K0B436_9ARCH|nr:MULTISPECIES: response regulator [Nitrosopumilus]AFS80858.1 protein MprA [Candidatus Nitrosopumilus koreensis AR1]
MSDIITAKKELSILIIDDNEQITKMISTFLSLNSHKCTIANHAQDGLEYIIKNDYDAVILDLTMPDMDGYDILEKIKESDIRHKVIVLTASNVSQENIKKIKQTGTKIILQKPVDIDTLLEKIYQIVDV